MRQVILTWLAYLFILSAWLINLAAGLIYRRPRPKKSERRTPSPLIIDLPLPDFRDSCTLKGAEYRNAGNHPERYPTNYRN